MAVILSSSNGQIIPVSSTNEYRWEIANFVAEAKKLKEFGQMIVSPAFVIDATGKSFWNLELYPNGFNESNAGNCVLLLSTDSEVPVGVRFKFSILDDKKHVTHIHQSHETRVNNRVKTGAVIVKTAVLLSKANEILVDGKLIVSFEITVNKEQCDADKSEENRERRLKQFDKFEGLLNNKKHSDLIFAVEGKNIYAHKAIVTFGSPVFAAMFKHDMEESKNNVVTIKETSYAAFREFLRFMYCGKVHHLDEMAAQLFVVADKYEMMELKEICEDSLRKSLSAENAVAYLKLAELHHSSALRDEAMKIMVERSKDVSDDPEFQSVLHLRESITMDFIRRLIAHQRDN